MKIFHRRNAWSYNRMTKWRRIFEQIWISNIFSIISLIRLLKYSFNRFRSSKQSKNEVLTFTMWKVITSSEVFRSVNSRVNVLSMPKLILDSTVFVFNLNLTSLLLIRSRALNCSMFSIDCSAASQFISMFLNSQSSYRASVVEIKLNDSLMKIIMMIQFFEIKRCLNVWFSSKLMIMPN